MLSLKQKFRRSISGLLFIANLLCIILIYFPILHIPVLSSPAIASEKNLSREQIKNIEGEILSAINMMRAGKNLPPLEINERISSLARAHARDMATRNFFSTVNPEKESEKDRAMMAGIAYSSYAENILSIEKKFVLDTDEVGLASLAVKAWASSPDTMHNLMNEEFSETGIGLFQKNDGSLYVVADFLAGGFSIVPPPEKSERVMEILEVLDSCMKHMLLNGETPESKDSLRERLSLELEQNGFEIKKDITVKKTMAGRNVIGIRTDIIIEGAVLVIILKSQSKIAEVEETAGDFLRGKKSYQALVTVSLEPFTWSKTLKKQQDEK